MTFSRCIGIAVFGLFGLYGCHESTNTTTVKHNDFLYLKAIHPLGQAYASSSINVPVFREQSILKLGSGEMVVAYFDHAGEVRLDILAETGAVRRTTWVGPRLEDRLLSDGHCAISLGRSPDGVVHIMYGAHDTDPFYTWVTERQLLGAPNGDRLTAIQWGRTISYPQFYLLGRAFQMWFRADPSSAIHRTIYVQNSIALPRDSESLLVPGNADRVYMNQLAILGKRVALTWMYRLFSTDDVVRNEGLYLALSDNAGKTWRAQNGQPLSFPVQRGSQAPFVEVGSERQPLNQTSSRFGPDGRLYVTWYAKDNSGYHQIFLGVLDAESNLLSTQPVSKNQNKFDLLGRGTLVLPLSRPQIVVSRRFVHVVYRQDNKIVIASQTTGSKATSWSYLQVDAGDLMAWEPTISAQSWEEDKRLLLYVQPARQGITDTAILGGAEQASIYEFVEF